MQTKQIYLSHILDEFTPTYGNRNKFVANKKSDISKGDVANDTSIETTVHIGTHIDMPYHFFDNGQTIEDFDVEYFDFSEVLFIDLKPKDIIIEDDLICELGQIEQKDKYDILIVKTGICHRRDSEEFWSNNYGFSPKIAHYIRDKFPNIRVLGFDSISVSSFANRMLGRESHRVFLSPDSPILLLEDMDLRELNDSSCIEKLTIAPMRINKCDGLPCTVVAKVR